MKSKTYSYIYEEFKISVDIHHGLISCSVFTEVDDANS